MVKGTLTLKQFQEKFGIKRIDFSKIKPTGIEETYEDDKLICPYCHWEMDIDIEDIDNVLGGVAIQCPECEKFFYATGEITVNTTCTPMEDAVLQNQGYIQDLYDHCDKCEERGVLYNNFRYGTVEWDMYEKYAKPLFENLEVDNEKNN